MNEKLRTGIEKLKIEKNAVIVGHYYISDDAQDICDYIGDSFALAKQCTKSDARIILFAGVHFMAESAKLLCPEKKVLIPDMNAGCKMADMAEVSRLRELKKKYPQAAVVCYINTVAAVKAECDVCVTSSNAVKIVRALPQKQILFVPDRNLGGYVQECVPEKEIICWDGCCPVHDMVSAKEVRELKAQHPEAKVLSHPECQSEIRQLADYVGSTKGMLEYVKASCDDEFIILTEIGILHEMKMAKPNATFLTPTTGLVCEDMKLPTPELIYDCLLNETNEVVLSEEIMNKANQCLNRMLEMSK